MTAASTAMSESFGGFSRARLEAFSDGVIAVIITIMVLELKAPESPQPAALLALWPNLAIYLVSFVFVAIYWINHHALLSGVEHTTPAMIWANNCLLFFLSLIPFATAYVGATGFAPLPTAIYAALHLACGSAFFLLMTTIVRERPEDAGFAEKTRAYRRKNLVAVAAYAAAVMVAALSPLAAIVILVAVALTYVKPSLSVRRSRRRRLG
jgi:uncharacterized membrane protein